MIFDVEWSGEAQVTYAHILEELGLQWTTKEIEKFISRTDYVINLIRRNPELYAYSKKGEVHRAVISRQTSLYYMLERNKILLLAFEDNRQNPEKLKY